MRTVILRKSSILDLFSNRAAMDFLADPQNRREMNDLIASSPDQGGAARIHPSLATGAGGRPGYLKTQSALVLGDSGSKVMELYRNKSSGGSKAGACDPCGGKGGCDPNDGEKDLFGGDLPGQGVTIRLRTVDTSCGEIEDLGFQPEYSEHAATFASAWARAKAEAQFRKIVESLSVTGTTTSIVLNAPAGVTGLKTLGLVASVSVPGDGAIPDFLLTLAGTANNGQAWSTGAMQIVPDGAGRRMKIRVFAYTNVRDGQYYYSPLNLDVSPAVDLVGTFSGLPIGSTVSLATIPTDSRDARAIVAKAELQ